MSEDLKHKDIKEMQSRSGRIILNTLKRHMQGECISLDEWNALDRVIKIFEFSSLQADKISLHEWVQPVDEING